jgi:autotransporter-associated beta strand protein
LEWGIGADQGDATITGNMPTMILTNSANDWAGNTTIGRGRLRVGGTGEVIPDGPGAGDVTLVGEIDHFTAPALQIISGVSVLSLDSRTETVNGLFSGGALVDTFDSTTDLVFVTNSTVGEATLRVGANNASSTFGGIITDDTSVNGIVKLVKIESGTFTVTSDKNAWGGDTRVEGGKMTITTNVPNLADLADVHVLTGAQLELNYTGTDSIDSLFLGGIQRAAGEWGSLASAAPNKNALLLGLGTLTVLTGPGSGAVGAVPEPGTFGLLLVAALFGVGTRRGRQSIV